jgi:hypothetical protein
MRTSTSRASSVSGSALPSSASARSSSAAMLCESSGRKVRTRARDRSAAFSSNDGAVLHHRQEGILLRTIEAVDLVDEEQRLAAGGAPQPCRLEHLFQVGDAGEDRRNLLEGQPGLAGEQPRHGRLAGARRPPEHHRAERAGADHPRQRPFRPGQVLLPDHLRKHRRPQPVGERPADLGFRLRRRGEQVGHGDQ